MGQKDNSNIIFKRYKERVSETIFTRFKNKLIENIHNEILNIPQPRVITNKNSIDVDSLISKEDILCDIRNEIIYLLKKYECELLVKNNSIILRRHEKEINL